MRGKRSLRHFRFCNFRAAPRMKPVANAIEQSLLHLVPEAEQTGSARAAFARFRRSVLCNVGIDHILSFFRLQTAQATRGTTTPPFEILTCLSASDDARTAAVWPDSSLCCALATFVQQSSKGCCTVPATWVNSASQTHGSSPCLGCPRSPKPT
jgi:hypothetical protein